jgi:hypothetical protein
MLLKQLAERLPRSVHRLVGRLGPPGNDGLDSCAPQTVRVTVRVTVPVEYKVLLVLGPSAVRSQSGVTRSSFLESFSPENCGAAHASDDLPQTASTADPTQRDGVRPLPPLASEAWALRDAGGIGRMRWCGPARLVLHGTTFPSKTIAELIRGLRRLREHGGAIELTPASGGVRATLALTGLDRVFRVIPLHEPTFVRRRLRHRSWRPESRASLTELSRQRRSPCSSQAGGGT